MPKQSLKAIVRLLRGACPERHEILRYAQNGTKRRARNDKETLLRLHPKSQLLKLITDLGETLIKLTSCP